MFFTFVGRFNAEFRSHEQPREKMLGNVVGLGVKGKNVTSSVSKTTRSAGLVSKSESDRLRL
jgi:hypothetical protein